MPTGQRITFHVPNGFAIAVVAWEQTVNWQVLRHTIMSRGAAAVIRYMDQKQLHALREVPGLGEAEPHYGEFGGGFAYTFFPEEGNQGCVLRVTHATGMGGELGHYLDWQPGRAAPKPGSIGLNRYDRVIPPLMLHIPECWRLEKALGRERWASPQLVSERTRQEASAEEFYFWIDGRMMMRLIDWGWRAVVCHQYAYHFYPLSVGCELYVTRQDSNDLLHLTAGVLW